jgi:transmembrane amino acid transporter
VGIPSTISILVSVLIVMIALGVSGPSNAEDSNPDIDIIIVGSPTFIEGLTSCLNICYAYAGNVGFVSYMAEMQNPSKDFVPALFILQGFSIPLYVIVAIVIYTLSGQYTRSPSLGSAPILPAKIAYGIVLPCLLATGMVFGHTAIKYLYVVIMKKLRATDEITSRTRRSWGVWIGCATFYWVGSFIMANAIPIFDSILSISSSTLIAWFVSKAITFSYCLHADLSPDLWNQRRLLVPSQLAPSLRKLEEDRPYHRQHSDHRPGPLHELGWDLGGGRWVDQHFQ